MSGSEFALTDRDRALLAEVRRHGAITREQLVSLRLFSSKTRANERLHRLAQAGYLVGTPQPLPAGGPRLVYSPGPLLESNRAIRRRIPEASTLFVAHQLGMVDVRIAFEQHTTVSRWLSDADLAHHSLGVIPDAYIEFVANGLTYSAFVEYDRGTEPLGEIERKVRSYLDLAFSGRFERTFNRRFFRTLFVSDSANRLASMSKTTARLTNKIVRLALLRDLRLHGPTRPIWRRPGGNSLEPLTT